MLKAINYFSRNARSWMYVRALNAPLCTTKELSSRGALWKSCSEKFGQSHRKQLCQSLFFNKVVGLRTAILLIKRLGHRCFPVSFAKFLRTAFLIEHLWQLLLSTIHVFYFDFCKETLKRNIFPLNFLDYSFVVFYNEVRHSLVTKSSYPN